MAKEIERKFLVLSDHFKKDVTPVHIRQGFVSTEKNNVVRVRVAGSRAFLTLKNEDEGITRNEFDYEIPPDDANEIIKLMCGNHIVEKYRYILDHEGKTWEIDEFLGLNEGLIIAEVELQSENEAFDKPPWLGAEVTHDKRYLNASLALHPYDSWVIGEE
jgi:adenylate cyclase